MSLIDEYLKSFKRKSDATIEGRGYVLGDFARGLPKPLDEATKEDVEGWITRKVGKEKLKPGSINQYLSIVKGFYKWLIDELPIPVEREELRETLEKQRGFRKIISIENLEPGEFGERALEEAQLRALLKESEAEPDHHRAIFLGGYFGCRRDELRLLQIKDVDFKERKISIRRETTKTPAGVRELYFHPSVGGYLRSKGRYVLGHGSDPYSEGFFYSLLRKYDRVVRYHLRFKQLRTTFNTWMGGELDSWLSKRDADFILKRLMGHKTRGQDMSEHYKGETARIEKDKRRAMAERHYYIRWGLI